MPCTVPDGVQAQEWHHGLTECRTQQDAEGKAEGGRGLGGGEGAMMQGLGVYEDSALTQVPSVFSKQTL